MFTFQNRSRAFLLAVMAVALSALAAGCGGALSASSATSASQSAPETQRSIATAIALKAAQSAADPVKKPASTGPRTVSDISATAPTSGMLDNVHLAAGKGCDACHDAIQADSKPAPVTTTRCLSCHGGSYDAVAAKTANLGTRNPHKAHTGKEDCDRCHHVHQPFEYSCNACHTFPIPAKYAVAPPNTVSPGESQQSNTGATHKETED